MDEPAWGENHVKALLDSTLPPGEEIEKNTFDDRTPFIEILTLSITLKEDGKLLFDELRKKWPNEVQTSMMEAAIKANKTITFGSGFNYNSNKSPEENWEALKTHNSKLGIATGEMPKIEEASNEEKKERVKLADSIIQSLRR